MSDLLDGAKEKLKRAVDHWGPIYRKAREDLDFLSDDEFAQWNPGDAELRRQKGRPTLTIDQLGQFVNQVSNDIRMNTPSINVAPHGGGADVETAEIFKGLIRDIEHRSNADDAYDNAVNFAIESSIGFIRVDHDYTGDEGFEQDLKICRVTNPQAVFLDADTYETDGSDAMCGMILEKMHNDEFKKRWPGKEPVSFEVEGTPICDKEEELYVLEYFKVEEEPYTIFMTNDGEKQEVEGSVDLSDRKDVVASREIKRRKVYRCWLSGKEELEKGTFPGKYIPIVPVYGKEAWRNGKRELHSLIRKAKDAQRMFNYWKSMETELLMKQPKAPVVAVAGTTEDFAEDWQNPDKATVLRYNLKDLDGNPAPAPTIGNSPQIPAGIVNAAQQATQDIKSTMGLYNAFLGDRSNETSGVAIKARKVEGDRAVYHFGDNLVRSITHMGRILVSAIPDVYDTPRIVSIIGSEDEAEMVGINGALVEGQEKTFDLTTGQYNVRVTTGATHATMREEAANFFQQIAMTSPELLSVIGDLVFRYMDFPGAQAVADRMKRSIDPKLLGEGDDPALEAAAAQIQQLEATIMQLQQQGQALQEQLKDKQMEIRMKAQTEMAKTETERQKQQVEIEKLEVEREKIALEHQETMAEIGLKQQEIALKERELQIKAVEQAQQNVQTVMQQPDEIPQ